MAVKSQLELLEIQDQEAVKNTYYRCPRVTPHVIMDENKQFIQIKTIDHSTIINTLDEIVLYIIARFRWTPAWLIHQWYELYNINGYAKIAEWINVGIVWAQTGSTGVFIRPTFWLFEQMDIHETYYSDIPFNLLNHTCAEMQIVFDVMSGNDQSEIWTFIKGKSYFPEYHPLNIHDLTDSDKQTHTPIFMEDEYKSSLDPQYLKDKQDQLIQSIRNRDKFTMEFSELSLFTLITEDNSAKNKTGYYTQRPDLVIPSIRATNGQPLSWAIEMELSPKPGIRYEKIMQSYKNNLIYGFLVYLCGNNYIVEQVKKAYKEAGGLGTCKLYVAPWVAPAQRITDYSIVEETAYRNLLSLTEQNTMAQESPIVTN